MKHTKEEMKAVIDPNSSPYATLKKGERDALYVCFGSKKCWTSSLAAKRHFQGNPDSAKAHDEFLQSLGFEKKETQTSFQSKRIKELELQLQDAREEIAENRRFGREQDLINELRWWSEWSMMLTPMFDFILDRLTPEEKQTMTKFWATEHNIHGAALRYGKTPHGILENLREEIKQNPFLQMMLIPNFESYRNHRQIGRCAELTTLIEGMALFKVDFIPDRHGLHKLRESHHTVPCVLEESSPDFSHNTSSPSHD
jgi:hypothetical protein